MNTNHNSQKKSKNALEHLLRNQKIYLSILLLLLSGLSFFSNYLQEKPLLIGGESYYYLSSAEQELPYNPMTMLFKNIPGQLVFLLPPLLSVSIVLLFYALAEKIKLSEKKTFFITLFYILTPIFVFTSLTISSYSLDLALVLLGINLMLSENRKKYFALLPFLLASAIDAFSALFLLAGTILYFFILKRTKISDFGRAENQKGFLAKEKGTFPALLILTISVPLILNATLLNTPFFIGPFMIQDRSVDLISDLGGVSGVGFFSILLAFIGVIPSWQKKNLPIMIPALIVFITAYWFNTHTVFFLSLLIVILAAAGFVYLQEQTWKLSFLRNAVLLLLLLGLTFSTVSYLDRLSSYPPTSVDQKALQWIERNTDEKAIVLSAPENSYYISYFAQRKPVFALHQDYQQQYNWSEHIFKADYINQLFPLLEKDKVSIIYISDDMKRTLPQSQGFLFLLQNERFKLLYFSEDAEVWSFEEAKQ